MRVRSLLRPAVLDDLDRLLETATDAIVLSLTDETRPIDELRREVAAAIERIAGAGKRAFVALNHPRTQLLRGDAEAIVSPKLAGVLLPHCVEPQDVRDTAVALREFEHARDIEPGEVVLFPVIDTARGVLRAADIVEAAPRTAGLVFASDAYARDVGARPEEKGARFAYARGAVIAAARAHDRLPLIDGSALELREMANYGFAGAVLDEPRLAQVANDVFTPSEFVVRRARAVVDAYQGRGEGAWVARYQGAVVDSHRVRKARQIIEAASADDE